jgi:ABC-type uncharacterized transport system permease subunit
MLKKIRFIITILLLVSLFSVASFVKSSVNVAVESEPEIFSIIAVESEPEIFSIGNSVNA